MPPSYRTCLLALALVPILTGVGVPPAGAQPPATQREVDALRQQLWESMDGAGGEARRSGILVKLASFTTAADPDAAIDAATLVVKFGARRDAERASDAAAARFRDEDRLARLLAGALFANSAAWATRLQLLERTSRSRAVVGTSLYLRAADRLGSPATRAAALRTLAQVSRNYREVPTTLMGAGSPPRLGTLAAATLFRETALAPGARLPEMQARTLDGKLTGSADLPRKVVVIDFWATWCPPCIAAFPKMAAMRQRLGREALEIVSLSADNDPAVARRFVERVGASWRQWHIGPTGRVSSAWVNGIYPFYVVVGRDGRIVGTATRFDEAAALVERAIRAA